MNLWLCSLIRGSELNEWTYWFQSRDRTGFCRSWFTTEEAKLAFALSRKVAVSAGSSPPKNVTWEAMTGNCGPSSKHPGDFDGDGFPDVLCLNHEDRYLHSPTVSYFAGHSRTVLVCQEQQTTCVVRFGTACCRGSAQRQKAELEMCFACAMTLTYLSA